MIAVAVDINSHLLGLFSLASCCWCQHIWPQCWPTSGRSCPRLFLCILNESRFPPAGLEREDFFKNIIIAIYGRPLRCAQMKKLFYTAETAHLCTIMMHGLFQTIRRRFVEMCIIKVQGMLPLFEADLQGFLVPLTTIIFWLSFRQEMESGCIA